MAKIKMADTTIAKYIGEMCYEVTTTKQEQAVQLFFEKMCLPKFETSYTAESMAKYIRYFIKNKKIFQPSPSQTKL